MLFSVIVPVFNAEIFLVECIQSVLKQTWTDFELILVNDGSTDTSESICMAYTNIDQRVSVITQVNKGQTAARMAGMQIAKGSFCIFLDADDRLSYEALAIIAQTIEETHCDMVLFDYVKFDETTRCPVYSLFDAPRVFEFKDFKTLWREYALRDTLNSMCTKAVHLNCISLAEIAMHPRLMTSEDMLMGMCILKTVRSVAYINLPLYEYRQHKASIVHKTSKQKLNDLIIARVLAQTIIETTNIFDYDLMGRFNSRYVLALTAELAKMFRSNIALHDKKQAFYFVMRHPEMQCFLNRARMKNQRFQDKLRLICAKLKLFWMLYGLEKVINVYKEIVNEK